MQDDSPRPGRSDYLDFDLEIGSGTGRDYPVAVLDSPAGGARGNMHFPFDDLVLENRLLTLQNALLRSGGEPRRTLSPEEQKVRDFGQALFEALFIPDVRSCYDVSLREAARRGRGLRLKLRIQPPELAALPWEYLYHPGQAEYVSLSTQTPVVRYLEVPQRIQPLLVEPPLRILGMIASPSDLPSLDIEREKSRIAHAIRDLGARGLVDLAWLPGQSWRDLQRAMRQGPWHIFHFIGHGGFDRNTGEGLIVLADSEGRADWFHATRLGRLLADHASLRLVLLNSCEGARGSERDVFSSTASILVRRGIPAVLAMQYEITDRAAVEFARTFYEALADGMPVDGAVAEARKAISFAVANTVEWGTPVLYTRAPGGVLFQVTGAPRVERPTTEEPRPPPQVEKRLERLYVDGLGAFWIEEWDEACRCFQAIVDEQPDYRDAAARLEQAEHQRKLGALYTEAQTARAAKDWTGEFMALDRLVAEEPGFKDAVDLREAAKQKRQLARLYAQAQELHAAGRWQAVVNVFARIAALDPEYPDPKGLLSIAEREVAEQKRQSQLNDLYSHALREMDAGQWGEARGLLVQIQEMEVGYRETERLLSRAEAEIAEQRRQAKLDGLHSDALQALDARRWQEARGLLVQIQEMEDGYRETEQLLAKVDAELAEQQRQAELDGLYNRAVREMNAGRWEEAQGLLAQVQEIEAGYRETERLLATAEAEIAARRRRDAEAEPALPKRRLPGWAIAAIAGLAVVAIIVTAVLLRGGPTPTPTPAFTSTTTSIGEATAPSGVTAAPPPPSGGAPVPGSTPANPTAGAVWEWSDGSAMVYVPVGAFWMGSSDEDVEAVLAECSDCERDRYTSEQPQHEVTLDTFWMDRTEVTNGQYRRCVEDGVCTPPVSAPSYLRDNYDDPAFDDYPVTRVDWTQADEYCTWAGKRLPTEAEWEKAARGKEGQIYPWGNSAPDCSKAKYFGCGEMWSVGSKPTGASPYGALDMAGNAWEWVADWYGEDYYANSPDSNPLGPETGTSKVLRGGGTAQKWYDVRAAGRSYSSPDDSTYTYGHGVGFRCAVSPGERPSPEPTRTPGPTDTPVLPTDAPAPPTDTPTATPTWTPTLTLTPQAGATRIWEPDDSVMVYVPAGAFRMGSSDEDIDAILAECSYCQRDSYANEQPQHEVSVDAFWIDRTEVTNAQYAAFLNEQGNQTEDGSSWLDLEDEDCLIERVSGEYHPKDGYADHPVVAVTWYGAGAYCTWAGKRLPSEAEWEKAARETEGQIYPWGNSAPDCSKAQYSECAGQTVSVGGKPTGASPYGALDMAGNVWEWVADWYDADYYADSPDSNPRGPDTGTYKVVRGGGWDNSWGYLRAAYRFEEIAAFSDDFLGFRCVVSPGERLFPTPTPTSELTDTSVPPTDTPTSTATPTHTNVPPTHAPLAQGSIAFVSDRDGNQEIYVMNADGSGITRLTYEAATDYSPAWSPDGKRIVFASTRDGSLNSEIYVMNADGSGQTKLTNNPTNDNSPTWSPDGQRIAFASDRDRNWEIYAMNADGSGETNLTNEVASNTSPAWSPDGQRIAFTRGRWGNEEIYVMNIDGSGRTNLTNRAVPDYMGAWSPDGRYIVFASGPNDNADIYVMNADGSGVTRLTNDPSYDWSPVWSPN